MSFNFFYETSGQKPFIFKWNENLKNIQKISKKKILKNNNDEEKFGISFNLLDEEKIEKVL